MQEPGVSCFSGGFIDDFKDSSCLGITTADKTHHAVGYEVDSEGTRQEAVFSKNFWDSVKNGYNVKEAYFLAYCNTYYYTINYRPDVTFQNPQILQNSGYIFFN